MYMFMHVSPTTPYHPAVFQITPTIVMAQLQGKDSADDDLLAGWSSELEALLYSPEVEEAIKEVSPCQLLATVATCTCYPYFWRVPPLTACAAGVP